jgi:hypothetical protein
MYFKINKLTSQLENNPPYNVKSLSNVPIEIIHQGNFMLAIIDVKMMKQTSKN